MKRRKPRNAEKHGAEVSGVVNSLRHLVRAIRLSSHVAEETLGISGAQLFVLQQLADSPATSLHELAARTLTDQSSVSVVVSRLVRRGLVGRRVSERDARRVEVWQTAKGRQLFLEAPELAPARLVSALRSVPLGDLRVVRRVLAMLAREVGADSEPPQMFFERAVTKRRRAR